MKILVSQMTLVCCMGAYSRIKRNQQNTRATRINGYKLKTKLTLLNIMERHKRIRTSHVFLMSMPKDLRRIPVQISSNVAVIKDRILKIGDTISLLISNI